MVRTGAHELLSVHTNQMACSESLAQISTATSDLSYAVICIRRPSYRNQRASAKGPMQCPLLSAVCLWLRKGWGQATGWGQCCVFHSVLWDWQFASRKDIWPVKTTSH